MKINFNQINWEKEIERTPLKTEKGRINELTMALKRWLLTQSHFIPIFKEETNTNKKSNTMRIIQYFLADYLWCRNNFYNIKDDYNPIKGLNYETLECSKLPITKIIKIKWGLNKIINKTKEVVYDGGYNEIKQFFIENGLNPIKPKSINKEYDRDTVCIKHDKVPYHISIMKDKTEIRKESVLKHITKHNDNIEKYHKIVKKLYDNIVKLNIKDLWVLEGAGAQVQMFFGDKTGYIAILYLDLRNEATAQQTYTLQIQNSKNNKLFENFKMEGIEIKKHKD